MLQRVALVFAALPVALLIAAVGPLNVLWADAATFLCAAAILGLRRMPAHNPTIRSKHDFREGWRFIRTDRFITLILVTAVLLTALEAPLVSLVIPVLTVASGPHSLGHLVLAYAGGMLGGAAVLAVAADRVPRRPFAVACLAVIGAGYAGLVVLPPPWWLPVLAVMGFATGPLAPLIVSSVQQRTPAHMVGQVTGALLALVMAAIPLGRAATGYAIEAVGIEPVLAVCALAYLVTMGFLAHSRHAAELTAPTGGSSKA
jgi:predicted MFS family arabinose efflux permease